MTSVELKTKILESIKHVYNESEAKLIAKYYLEDKAINNRELTSEELSIVLKDVQRLANAEPLQYVTGVAHFYGYKFQVDSSVLIPRPETEELVNEALSLLKQNSQIYNVLDIGTGSGCILNTIALQSKRDLNLVGIDVSEEALINARKNANHYKLNTKFAISDFLSEAEWDEVTQPELIISNPPYISTNESNDMKSNVLKYEPHIALFSHEDPLMFYKKIAAFGHTLLKLPYILCEINEYLGIETVAVFKNYGYENVELIKDLQGKDRIIKVMPKVN